MVSTASTDLPHIPGYSIFEPLYTGSKTAVYRALRANQPESVVIKLLQREYPSFSELVQFRNQYTIAKNLTIPGIVHPLSLEPWRNSFALVMEDVGGLSVKQYAQGKSLDSLEVLVIARQLAEILHELIDHRVVHKDIKPANILICPQSKQIQLIDFSIASLLPKETQELKNPNVLEGTLAYLAPEQTGRMNRGIDYRTDFYGLGATLYELLTGQLPFPCDDPLELVHCHIAKPPIPPHQINPNIPPMVSAIVLKLMAKNAEDRYQSALGLKYDLEQCLSQSKETGTVTEFELAQRDVSDRFVIPEKLYGREGEVQQLLAAFERVAEGQTELMLVAGFSGIGKTAVVNEVDKPIVRKRGYFIKGKFDQFNRNIPFSALVQALGDLMRQILSESDTQLQQWKSQILDAVGENGQVIIEVIPELEKIIGQQPPITELSGSAAQNRFNLLFSQFIQVFTTKEHPLVIFLDDLQWADSASLNLIKLLMSQASTAYLLMMGAYRDNEVFPAHPLMLTLDEMGQAKATINRITLGPLSVNNINHLVADTFSCDREVAKPLTELVYQKTKGNPFFTTQFLLGLYGERLIQFNRAVGHWECDIAEVRQRALTDDVVEFMAGQLQKLPAETQQVLKLAACIGNQFDLQTLAIVSEQSQGDTATALWKALQEGFVLPQSEVYKFYLGKELSGHQEGNSQAVNYKFLHDRVQQAAYSLIPDSRYPEIHLAIGQLLLDSISKSQREERIFEIVNQLNQGIQLLDLPSSRTELAQLNLSAARKAITSTAYIGAMQYLQVALSLLELDCWDSQYELALSVYVSAVEAAYLNAQIEQMHQFAEIVFKHTHHLLDAIIVHQLKIRTFIAQNQFIEAIESGLSTLKLLGIDLPKNPTDSDVESALFQIGEQVENQGIDNLLNLPKMQDQTQVAALTILTSLISASYKGFPQLFILIILKGVELSIESGHHLYSPYCYGCYAIVMSGILENLDNAYEMAQITLKILDKIEAKESKAQVLFVTNSYVFHWKQHLVEVLQPLQESYTSALEVGDFEYAGYGATFYCWYSYFSGKNLVALLQEMENYRQVLIHLKQEPSLNFHQVFQQATLNFVEGDEKSYYLRGEVCQEEPMLSIALDGEDKNLELAAYIYCNKLILSYLLDASVLETFNNAVETEKYICSLPGSLLVRIFNFYSSLAYLSAYDSSEDLDQPSLLQKVEENQKKMQHWVAHAPMNCQHQFHLIEAEKSRVLNQKQAAIELYDQAISGAKENEYIQEEALANELAAQFYLDWGKDKIACIYMQEAYYCYARWGAKAKIDDLEKRYPHLLRPILEQARQTLNPLETLSTLSPSSLSIYHSISTSCSSTTNINNTLDFAAVLKASQALSGMIELDQLLSQLTQTILQNSGGDRCGLIHPHSNGEWSVKAIATLENTELCSQPLENHPNVPIKLIQYVKNTQETVVVDDLKTDLPVIGDYLLAKQPKSILCLPILNPGNLLGILYLENQSTCGAFTRERILVLNFLCTQAAISLENARLYQQAQDYAQKLEQSQLQIVQSEKMASLGNLMAGVAHEINNPLGFLNGSISNAKDYLQDILEHLELYQTYYPNAVEPIQENAEEIDLDFLSQDIPKLLNSMAGATKCMKNISTSLGTFSRADTEHKVSAHLHQGLESTLMILKYRLKANENRPAIQVIRDYGELSEVQCFPGQLNQVFMNIIANAIDVFDEMAQDLSDSELDAKPQTITIKTRRLTEENAVEIMMGDNGKGMPPAVKSRIFDHLFTTKGVGKGTGLGLAISRQIIVEKHGGSLEVDSSLGQGTQFYIRLPIF